MAEGYEHRPENVLFATNPASNDDTPRTVIDNISEDTLYIWIKNAYASYTPIQENKAWCYIAFRVGNSKNYSTFLALNPSDGEMYQFSYGSNKWYKYTGVAVV